MIPASFPRGWSVPVKTRNKTQNTQIPLVRWLSASYLRTAVIPLCLIELGFLLSYWATGNFTYQRNVQTVNRVSEQYLVDIAAREAASIDATLSGIGGLARILSLETKEALTTPWTPDAAEKARYHIGPDGVFHTIRGGPDDTASFYSGYVPVGRSQIEKAWQTGQLDHTMRHIKTASPLVRQVYLNTWDSYNRIYPYFNVLEQYAPRMNIPSYNFFYEADASHNPARKVVWTDAYVDPAGSGWMVSAVAPVYSSRKLEAVVGIDLTIDTIVKRILSLDLPWQGYAMLIGRDGTILALPPAGEKDLELSELKNHDYAEAIFSDTFKPERFNIARRPELRELARAVRAGRAKVSHITLAGRDMLATTASVTGPGWSLVVVAPAARILADANYLHDQLVAVGVIMLLILLVFYAVFFSFLLWRARVMSRRVAEPLLAIEQLIDRIGAGQYSQAAPQFGVREIDNLSSRLADMGERLGDAHDVIVEQQAEMARTLESERRVTSGQRRFIQILSHEFRTPLTVIDSCGQILRRRADRLTAQAVVERSDMIRGAAGRIREVMQSALQLVQMEDGKTTCHPAPTSPGGLLRDAVAATQGTRPVVIEIAPDAETAAVYVDRLLVHSALAAIVENACRYSPEDTPVTVTAEIQGDRCIVTVTDQGSGISPEDLPMVQERFYRGSNSTAVAGAGTGLYLASSLLDANGGLLSIQSEVGKGTCVTASLPLAKAITTEFWEAA